ncbi:MAG: hypothetical protein Q8N18_17375 [Opitutaceae bacterium]|nr:hypothetical protein [Opitutaceae bacterium]
MKTFPFGLGATLAANFALLAVIAVAQWTSIAPLPAPSRAAQAPAPRAAPGPETWTALNSDQLFELSARLAAEGFPPWAVRAIVAAQVRERFSAQRKALEEAQAAVPYWRTVTFDPKLAAEFRALAREERSAVAGVLGRDPDSAPAIYLRRHFPGLAAEKLDRLIEMQERFGEQRQAVRDLQRGMTTPDDHEKLHQIDKAMRAEFATVLTAQELEDYDLRTSRVASSMRYQHGDFELTENEFRAVYRLKAEFDEQYPSWATRSVLDYERRAAAEKFISGQIALALGPERHEDYKRATDYSYRQASVLVARAGLPAETANSLFTTQREFEQRRDVIFAQPDSREVKISALRALHVEATGRLGGLLRNDPRLLAMYRENGGSWWARLASP